MKVRYDVGMSPTLKAESAGIDRLTGKYTDINNQDNIAEFFNHENRLWRKNEAFGDKFEYIGNNTFEEVGNPPNMSWKLEFKILTTGAVELTEHYTDTDVSRKVTIYRKQNA